MKYTSLLLENAVNEISKLPGIGRRSAQRLALHLLKQPEVTSELLANALVDLRTKVIYCRVCHNISDTEMCVICANPSRDHSVVCVVESINEVMAIENTGQYQGVYHVLGGIISPMNGVGPANLTISSLVDRVREGGVHEVIIALSTTMEGDTTAFFLQRKLSEYPVVVSTIARGIAFGDELEYTDEVTLGQSIIHRKEMK